MARNESSRSAIATEERAKAQKNLFPSPGIINRGGGIYIPAHEKRKSKTLNGSSVRDTPSLYVLKRCNVVQ